MKSNLLVLLEILKHIFGPTEIYYLSFFFFLTASDHWFEIMGKNFF